LPRRQQGNPNYRGPHGKQGNLNPTWARRQNNGAVEKPSVG
jgi:hypothetical protein